MVLRPALQRFAEQMEHALRDNEFRGDWRDRTPADMMASLWDELYDLDDEVEKMSDGVGDTGRILKEAVDVANYAMFVADICLVSMGKAK